MMKKLREALARPVESGQIGFGKIFVIQLILFFAIYGVMLIPRFSTDSYSVYFYTSDGLNGFLELGRTGTFLLYRILLALGVNSVTLSPLFTAVLCMTIAWSAAVVLSMLKICFPHLNWLTVLFLESAVVLAYGNIYFAELFFFSDVALMYVFAIVFMTLALILFFRRNKIFGTALALICMCASLSFYQAGLGMFMILGSVLTLVRHDVLWPRKEPRGAGPLLGELLRLTAVGGGASVVNVLTLRLLAMAGFYSDRAPASDLGSIFNSAKQTVQQFIAHYPWGYPSYLPGILKAVFILAGPVLLYLLTDSFDKHSRERYPLSSVAITLAALAAGFLLVFAPHLVANSVWMPPRSIFSFFALFTFMAVIAGYNYTRNGKSVPLAVPAVLMVLFAANVIVIQGIALDQVKVNRLDKAEAEEIVRYIREYEAESGQVVDTISWCTDSEWTRTRPEIKYQFMDMNVRAGGRSWSLTSCIRYYAGRRFRSEVMPDEVRVNHFQGQEWDSFVPKEQLWFEGHTMYLMAY